MAQALRSYPLPVRKGTGAPSRIVIEQIQPELDGGLFPVKRIVGDLLQVSADIFRDGHDKIAACMRLRETGSGEWTEAALHLVDNDRWAGSASLTRPGRSVFVIEAWTDAFASWSDEVQKKRGAGQAIELELMEGRAFLKAAAGRSAGESKQHLEDCLRRLDGKGFSEIDQYDLLTSPVVGGWMADAADRSDAALSPEREVSVDRAKARFSTWYEMFPRSQGQTPGQSATFRDCIKRLPDVRDMGFDVVYLVPIHPIGEINRKGRNNLVRAEAGDPGSPYAIGSRTGGHSAIEPGDRARFCRSVRPRPSVGEGTSRMVSEAGRRIDEVCRESPQEIRGHRQRGL
jgi:starch synthase (maltosyl-transferring)